MIFFSLDEESNALQHQLQREEVELAELEAKLESAVQVCESAPNAFVFRYLMSFFHLQLHETKYNVPVVLWL